MLPIFEPESARVPHSSELGVGVGVGVAARHLFGVHAISFGSK